MQTVRLKIKSRGCLVPEGLYPVSCHALGKFDAGAPLLNKLPSVLPDLSRISNLLYNLSSLVKADKPRRLSVGAKH